MVGDDGLVAQDAALPPVAGTPGLVQGVYGQRGNLELVVPDPEDGLWVFWFNADASGRAPGARPGCWSGGLHFGKGCRFDGAAIVQSRRGADWLEVAAAGDGRLRRYTWRPETGFTEEGAPLAAIGTPAAIEAADGRFHVAAAQPDGGVLIRDDAGNERLVRTGTRVSGIALLPGPELLWADEAGVHTERRELSPTGSAPSVAGEGPTAWIVDGRVVVEDRDGPGLPVPADALALASSTIERPQVELVARSGAQLWHARSASDLDIWEVAPLRSRVWTTREAEEVHRR